MAWDGQMAMHCPHLLRITLDDPVPISMIDTLQEEAVGPMAA